MNKWNEENFILKTDSYKLTHFNQYPDNTEGVYSYFESRKGAQFDFTLFFGLQYILMKHFSTRISNDDILAAKSFVVQHMGGTQHFNTAGWQHIVKDHGGFLPLEIKAVPEGSCIPVGNVLMTVENTCPQCYWLTNYAETLLSQVWYSSTVATLSKWVKNQLEALLGETGDPSAVNFMLHDFGFRGASSYETSEIGGAAHIINFMGTDTISGMVFAHEWYDASFEGLAYSVPASEHSVMTALGVEGELDQLDRLLELYPTGILSVVADSYNIYDFTDEVIKRKDQILARDGRFVLRPDSITTIHNSPSELCAYLVDELWKGFGGHINSKGYKVLDDHIRIIWGDGIDHHGIVHILRTAIKEGFAADNFVFGMGGGLLQKVNRDTQRFAFKCSAQKRDGVWHDVSKTPLDVTKKSKAGRLALYNSNGVYTTAKSGDQRSPSDLLEIVYKDGFMMRVTNFDEIRKVANG